MHGGTDGWACGAHGWMGGWHAGMLSGEVWCVEGMAIGRAAGMWACMGGVAGINACMLGHLSLLTLKPS